MPKLFLNFFKNKIFVRILWCQNDGIIRINILKRNLKCLINEHDDIDVPKNQINCINGWLASIQHDESKIFQ